MNEWLVAKTKFLPLRFLESSILTAALWVCWLRHRPDISALLKVVYPGTLVQPGPSGSGELGWWMVEKTRKLGAELGHLHSVLPASEWVLPPPSLCGSHDIDTWWWGPGISVFKCFPGGYSDDEELKHIHQLYMYTFLNIQFNLNILYLIYIFIFKYTI